MLSGDGSRPALLAGDGTMINRTELIARADDWRDRFGTERKLFFLEASNNIDAVTAYLGCLLGKHPVYLFADYSDAVRTLAERYKPDALVRPSQSNAITWADPGPSRTLHPSLALLLSTSGSTGSPKFVKLSLGNLVSNAQSIAKYLEIETIDRAMTSLSFAYSYGLSVINSHLFCGASVLLNNTSITDSAFWRHLSDGEATSFAGVPYTFEVLSIAVPSWAETPGLRHVTQAGGRLAPDKVRYFTELGRLHGWRFYVMYGQTECAPRIAYLPPEQAEAYPGCVGVPIPGGRIDLVDENGTTVEAADVPGELVYSGPNVMMGYAASDAELDSDETPAHHRTGDIACRNDAGLFYIVGRLSRYVKPYGLRVNLDELEALLAQRFPDAICTGTDDLIVVARTEADPVEDEAVTALLATRLKLPSTIFKVVHLREIPRLSNSKVDYTRVLALATNTAPAVELAPGWLWLWRRLFSLHFIRLVVIEAGQILGIGTREWGGVRQIYATMLNAPEVSDNSSFVGLAGDSLSYVQTSIALQDYLGHLPAGWEHLTVGVLEQEGPAEQPF